MTPGHEAPTDAEVRFRATAAAFKAARTTHPGRWVAIRDGAIIDADIDRGALYRRLAEGHQLAGTIFARIPAG